METDLKCQTLWIQGPEPRLRVFLFTGKCETKAGSVILQNVTEIKTHCVARH